jgi:hypothetical protein
LQVTKLSLEISNNKAASSFVFACGRSAEQLWRIFFNKLPRGKMMEESSVAGSSKKRCQLFIVDPQLPFLLSAGRGGEGEELRSLVIFAGGCCSGSLVRPGADSALVVAIPKLCLFLATAIHGHRVGLAMLELASSFFFLCSKRIYYCIGVATSVFTNPSGLVPGVGRDGGDWRQIFGGVHVLDRVFTVVCRVLCAKGLDLDVILSFFDVLLVKVYPPFG